MPSAHTEDPTKRRRPLIVVRLCKIALTASIALLFTFIAIGNITDHDSNWQFVQHVLSMDTIFQNSKLRSRAITDPAFQQVVYWLIIVTQGTVAGLLWVGCVRLLVTVTTDDFARAGTLAIVGLTVGGLLYVIGFIAIGGEWFAMWQSTVWNGQQKAFSFTAVIGMVLIVLLLPENSGSVSS